MFKIQQIVTFLFTCLLLVDWMTIETNPKAMQKHGLFGVYVSMGV